MRQVFLVLLIVSSFNVRSNNTEKNNALAYLLNDSVINKYISPYGGIDSAVYVLQGKQETLLFHFGELKRLEKTESIDQYELAKIRKLQINQEIAIIKILFPQKNLKIKAKLERSSTGKYWRIKTRYIHQKIFKQKDHFIYWFYN